ncbi:hypothetical protein Tco_0935917 [Tanacetum coccineum]
MLLNLITTMYVPFGIPFDPKRYYKDGVYPRMLLRPRFGEVVLDLDTAGALQFQLGEAESWRQVPACSIAGRSQAPKKVIMTDLFYLRGMDIGSVNIPYLLARYLRLFDSRSKHGAMISGGQFVACLAEYFGLLTKERLQGLTMIVRDLPVIDMTELGAAAGAPKAVKDALIVDEGAPTILAPVQASQPPPPADGLAQTMDQRLARVEEEVHEI